MSADLNEAECEACLESFDHSELSSISGSLFCGWCINDSRDDDEDEAWARDRRIEVGVE